MTEGLVVILMGVSGTGKTTVGQALAAAVGGRFVDADDLHPQTNVARMRRGMPLTDEDREPWLSALRAVVDESLQMQQITVLACSALTARSRLRLGTARDRVRLVYLHGPKELIESRMRGRAHFMGPDMLDSQLRALEPPDDALELDVSLPVETLVERIRGWLRR